MSERVDPLAWPDDPSFYLTLDYECDYGTALRSNKYEALEHTEWLVDLLERFDVPLTCFIQTKVLEEKPEQVEELLSANIPITFQPHSHTHRPRDETDISYEVRKSTRTFREFFGRKPEGYRLPNGNIRSRDYEILSEHDYQYDASVFPSWRPSHFDNRSESVDPRYLVEYDLYEIPFTVYSEIIRVPTALSYYRMLGRPYAELLHRRPPGAVIFNIHMHDLVNPPTFGELPPFYRAIYSRRTPGKLHLEDVLARFQGSEFSFGTIDDVYEALTDRS